MRIKASALWFSDRSTEHSKRCCAKGANCASRTRVGILYTDMLIHVYPYICIHMSICICVVRNAGIVRLERETYSIFIYLSIYMHICLYHYTCMLLSDKLSTVHSEQSTRGSSGEIESGTAGRWQHPKTAADSGNHAREVVEITRHQINDPLRHTPWRRTVCHKSGIPWGTGCLARNGSASCCHVKAIEVYLRENKNTHNTQINLNKQKLGEP